MRNSAPFTMPEEHNALVMIFFERDGSTHRGYVAHCPKCGWEGHEQMLANQLAMGQTNRREQAQLAAQREAERHNGKSFSGLLLPPGTELPSEVYEP